MRRGDETFELCLLIDEGIFMYEIEIKNMDLEQLANSGQCFRIKRLVPDGAKAEVKVKASQGIWCVTAGNRYVEILQIGSHFLFSCEEKEFYEIWRPYFDMDTDYQAVKEAVDPEDAYLKAAVACGGGVRILHQDLWEMIVTFLISQNNNIPRIGASVEALCERLGEEGRGIGLKMGAAGRVKEAERVFHSFPQAERVAKNGLEGLSGLGLGYRDKYVLAMASKCDCRGGWEWLASLKAADYHGAHGMLMAEFGIGRKVADCICLFGLHHIEAFPMDTHVKQIVTAHYPDGFPLKRYRGFAGILQQYMFYYKRKEG